MAAIATGWNGFVEWARLFKTVEGFETQEREGMERLIARVADARAKLTDNEYWLDALMGSFKSADNGLVQARTYAPFLDWISLHESRAATALRKLWSVDAGGPYGHAIDEFWDALPDQVVYGDAARANLTSYLMAGLDVEKCPVYRIPPFEVAFSLTRTDAPDDVSPGDRYDAVVALLDQFIAEAAERDVEIKDRLDAQTLVWGITSWIHKPDNFTDEQWETLLAYRGTSKVKARKAASATKKAASKPRAAAKPKAAKPTRAPRGICPLCATDEEVRALGRQEDGRFAFECDAHSPAYAFSMAGVLV